MFCVLSVSKPIILELFIPTCLRNLLTNYHENYISHLTPPAPHSGAAKAAIKEVIKLSPPAYRQDPLRRQLSNNYQDEKVSFQPPKYGQNPLLRENLCPVCRPVFIVYSILCEANQATVRLEYLVHRFDWLVEVSSLGLIFITSTWMFPAFHQTRNLLNI